SRVQSSLAAPFPGTPQPRQIRFSAASARAVPPCRHRRKKAPPARGRRGEEIATTGRKPRPVLYARMWPENGAGAAGSGIRPRAGRFAAPLLSKAAACRLAHHVREKSSDAPPPEKAAQPRREGR